MFSHPSLYVAAIPCQNSKWVTPSVLYSDEFSALVDITKNEDCKKIFEKLVLFVELYHFKNVIFTHYASLNMLKFLLNF